MQISIYVKNNTPEPGRNLAAGACTWGEHSSRPFHYEFFTFFNISSQHGPLSYFTAFVNNQAGSLNMTRGT